MTIKGLDYPTLLNKFYDQLVNIELTDGSSVRLWVDDIEDESDGWDELMFMMDGKKNSDVRAIPISKIKSIELA